jgi:hypothetical protein
MARGRTPIYRVAGLEPLDGKSRRWRDVHTGETLSYNQGRARVAAFSASLGSKTARFERALAQTKDVDAARKQSGLSKRGLDAYRRSFASQGRAGASPFVKDRGRWRFDAGRVGWTHTFVDIQGQVTHAPFVGRGLVVMQNYREAWTPEGILGRAGSQYELDAWLKENPAGVEGADGRTYFPETDSRTIKARMGRMSKRERNRFAGQVRYMTGERARAA